MNDVFEKIISREYSAYIIYEDELVIAFLDIEPINHGHTLVVPKKKFINIFDADTNTLMHMMRIAQKIAQALKDHGFAEGVNIAMNSEACAGQIVFHAHMHVIPRFAHDHAYKPARHTLFDATKATLISDTLKESFGTL